MTRRVIVISDWVVSGADVGRAREDGELELIPRAPPSTSAAQACAPPCAYVG